MAAVILVVAEHARSDRNGICHRELKSGQMGLVPCLSPTLWYELPPNAHEHEYPRFFTRGKGRYVFEAFKAEQGMLTSKGSGAIDNKPRRRETSLGTRTSARTASLQISLESKTQPKASHRLPCLQYPSAASNAPRISCFRLLKSSVLRPKERENRG